MLRGGQMKDRQAYKGYLIIQGLDGYFHVSKDSIHITSQPTLAKAKEAIDQLTEGEF